MKKTLYEILGVEPKASKQDIEAAYIARIDELKYATLQDPNKLRVLQQSKEILSDPSQRATYDASISKPATSATYAPVAAPDPEPSFLQQWGKWLAAVVVVIVLFALWPKRAATPPPPATQTAAKPAPVPQAVKPATPTNVPAPTVSAEPPPAEVSVSPLAGEWACADAISGRTAKYNFQQDAILKIAFSDGQIAESRYELAGKTLTLTDTAKVSTLTVEEMTTRKMILNTGAEGRRLVCKR